MTVDRICIPCGPCKPLAGLGHLARACRLWRCLCTCCAAPNPPPTKHPEPFSAVHPKPPEQPSPRLPRPPRRLPSGPHLCQRRLVGRGVVADGDLSGHAAHRVHAAPGGRGGGRGGSRQNWGQASGAAGESQRRASVAPSAASPCWLDKHNPFVPKCSFTGRRGKNGRYPLVAGLDQQPYVSVHEGRRHGDVGAAGEDLVSVVAQLLDETVDGVGGACGVG